MIQYKVPTIDRVRVRKSVCIPDQSMSVQEIVRRFVRGIPIDVKQREAVYVDQNDHDLEKLSRMDFGEKAEFARSEAERLKNWHNDLTEAEATKRSETEAIAKQESEARKKAGEAQSIVVP